MLAAEFADAPHLRLREAIVQLAGASTEYIDATPGRIVADLMAQAHARGALDEVRCDFTPERDSNGDEWTTRVSATYFLGTEYLTVLESLRTIDAAAFSLASDAVLHLANPVSAA